LQFFEQHPVIAAEHPIALTFENGVAVQTKLIGQDRRRHRPSGRTKAFVAQLVAMEGTGDLIVSRAVWAPALHAVVR